MANVGGVGSWLQQNMPLLVQGLRLGGQIAGGMSAGAGTPASANAGVPAEPAPAPATAPVPQPQATVPATGQAQIQPSQGIGEIAGGTPNLQAPMQSEVAQAASQDGIQPTSYLDRLTGQGLQGEELANWQKWMGVASLLSALGAGVGKDSLFGRYSNALHGMQAGALAGQNAKQAEDSANAMGQASANATSGVNQPLATSQLSAPKKTSTYTMGDSRTYGTITPEEMELVSGALRSWR